VRILQEGPLNKRGRFNTAFKRRWLVLTSQFKLLYFKEDNGQNKGEILIDQVFLQYYELLDFSCL